MLLLYFPEGEEYNTLMDMQKCTLCPRECKADRTKARGVCGADSLVRIGRAGAHFGEEPPIVGKRGSGAVFFSGCSLKCVFCQNSAISANGNGKTYSLAELEKVLLTLAESCENINLVTAAHYIDIILPVLERIKPRITVPVVYNSGGYEKAETVKKLDGIVDIYLPDYKYFDGALAEKYSRAADYPEIAVKFIDEVVRQQSKILTENGLIKKGVIIRHLVLPTHRDDSAAVLRDIARRWGGKVLVSLMSQYTPTFNRSEYAELNRKVTSFEYESAVREAQRLGLDGFVQARSSATEIYTPTFDVN